MAVSPAARPPTTRRLRPVQRITIGSRSEKSSRPKSCHTHADFRNPQISLRPAEQDLFTVGGSAGMSIENPRDLGVQFIVITNGAGRVAEVAARFTLDAMPGKQMAIDADL